MDTGGKKSGGGDVFKLVTQPHKPPMESHVTTHRVTSRVHSFVVFLSSSLEEKKNRQGAITIGSCRASTHSGGLPFFFPFRHKYLVACYLCLEIICMEIHLHQGCETKKKKQNNNNK